MTDAHSVRNPEVGQGYRWMTAVVSLTGGASFFGLWFWLQPQRLGFSVAGSARWQWLAAVPSIL